MTIGPDAMPFAVTAPPGERGTGRSTPRMPGSGGCGLPPPVVVFCKSHSGSRLLAAAIERMGVFLGVERNASFDALPMVPVVEHVVGRYHPDFSDWWRPSNDGDRTLHSLVRDAIARHFGIAGPTGGPWGWKLCETVYAVPVIDAMFPRARYIHLVRDGRDVAFCDHAVPDTPFWKKVYFGTDRLMTWRGRRLGFKDYLRRSHLFNAAHWCASVGLGRSYGAMLGPRHLEVRYERLCHDFRGEMRRIAAFLGLTDREDAVADLEHLVSTRSIGKHRARPRRHLREVLEIEAPLLLSLGYVETDPLTKPPRSLRRRLASWWQPEARPAAA